MCILGSLWMSLVGHESLGRIVGFLGTSRVGWIRPEIDESINFIMFVDMIMKKMIEINS